MFPISMNRIRAIIREEILRESEPFMPGDRVISSRAIEAWSDTPDRKLGSHEITIGGMREMEVLKGISETPFGNLLTVTFANPGDGEGTFYVNPADVEKR